MAVKKVYFVRHGEAEGNINGFTQTAATPLTDTGHHQASVVAELELRSSMKASNTGISLFEYDGEKWILRTWNDTAHFAE